MQNAAVGSQTLNRLNNMHKNTSKLRKIMRKHQMKAADVASIVNREVNTVRVWRCSSDNRVIPSELLNLVELTVQARSEQN